MATTSSISCKQYPYQGKAVGEFPWEKHKDKEKVEEIKLTVSPTLKVMRHPGGIRLSILGRPVAGFDRKTVSTTFSEGPFIDRFRYTIEPIGEVTCLDDSCGGTASRVVSFTTGETISMGLSASASGSCQSLGLLAGSGVDFQLNKAMQSNQQHTETEFMSKEYPDGSKRTVKFDMKHCKNGSKVVSYDPESILSLRHSRFNERMRLGFTPYGWFGGLNNYPDHLYRAPDCAISSIGIDWTLDYFVPNDQKEFAFNWMTEVRTVFATNSKFAYHQNWCHEYVNWIRTSHLIHQSVVVSLEDGQISAEKDELIVCKTGYQDQTETDSSEGSESKLINTTILI